MFQCFVKKGKPAWFLLWHLVNLDFFNYFLFVDILVLSFGLYKTNDIKNASEESNMVANDDGVYVFSSLTVNEAGALNAVELKVSKPGLLKFMVSAQKQ